MSKTKPIYVALSDRTFGDREHGTVWAIGDYDTVDREQRRAGGFAGRGSPLRWLAEDPPTLGQRVVVGEDTEWDC